MLCHQFPDLQWLKNQAEQRFFSGAGPNGAKLNHRGWPTIMLNVKAGETFRDNIPGPLSLFSNESGSSLVTAGNYTTVVPEDCFFMTNPGQRYTLEVEKKSPAVTFNIHFGEFWAEEVWSSLLTNPKQLEQDDARTSGTFAFYNKLYRKDSVMDQLIAELKSPINQDALKRDQILYNLLTHLLRQHYCATEKETLLSAAKASTRLEVLRRLHLATDFIYANYNDTITLEQLSAVSTLSRFHFLREFKRAFGKAPHQFLMDIRINKAKHLLSVSAMEVKDVGTAVGFDTSSSFSRQFRNQVGVYPTAWRAATT